MLAKYGTMTNSASAQRLQRNRRKYSFRAFYISTLLLCAITIFALASTGYQRWRAGDAHAELQKRAIDALDPNRLVKRDQECRLVHYAPDKCAFIKANCPDEEAGLFSYLSLYYCALPKAQPLAFIILVLWIGLLFTTIGIAASDFFCINLSTIATILGMSQSLTGVTFLAFGNGSPDVFSTFAAMSTHSGSMAIGELIGAAGFITAVVAGSMASVREFKVGKKSFVRDVGFFIVAASFSMVFLADGHLHLWECCVMIAFYIFYVVVVVTWHWYQQRQRRKRERIALSRGHFQGPSFTEIEVQQEDGDVEEDGTTGDASSRTNVEDFDALERGFNVPDSDDESDGEGERGRLLATEVSNSMRVLRPRGGRRSTMTPIRPSLVGAMEFRSVLASLQKARGSDAHHIHLRRYSDDRRGTYTPGRSYDEQYLSTVPSEYGGSVIVTHPSDGAGDSPLDGSPNRIRSASMNDATNKPDSREPAASDVAKIPSLGLVGSESTFPHSPDTTSSLEVTDSTHLTIPQSDVAPDSPTITLTPSASVWGSRGVSPAPATLTDVNPPENSLAPPASGFPGARHIKNGFFQTADATRDHVGDISESVSPATRPERPYISIPTSHSRDSSRGRASPRSPLARFPSYVDSPMPFGSPRPLSASPSREEDLCLPDPMLGGPPFYVQDCIDVHNTKPLSWWPYTYLPAPEVMRAALFPTFENWTGKNLFDKLISIVSAPSIFMLAITLPVVESEQKEDEEEVELEHERERSRARSRSGASSQVFVDGANGTPYSDNDNGIEPEWLAYRKNSIATPALAFPPHHRQEIAAERETFRASPQHHNLQDHPGNHAGKGLGGHGNVASIAVASEDLGHHNPHASDLTQSKNINPAQGYVDPTASPSATPASWNRWLVVVQIFTAPLFVSVILWGNMYDDLSLKPLVKMVLYGLLFSLIIFGVLVVTTKHDRVPKYRYLFCFLGFVVSIAWISTIANEVVGVLKALGVILGISDAILGLTVFAVGNSLGDLVADITVARLGYPVMALSACFGGPMLNILLGVGISGLYMTLTDANNHHSKHPNQKMKYKPYDIDISPTLLISAVSLLITLLSLLIVVPMNKWMMTRKIGYGLIALWSVSTVLNLVVEVTGIWGDDISHRFR